ncbi:MAG: hypothetical protein AAGE84_11955 [Cyanobacteria bacterium P01_G01_bin.39]
MEFSIKSNLVLATSASGKLDKEEAKVNIADESRFDELEEELKNLPMI